MSGSKCPLWFSREPQATADPPTAVACGSRLNGRGQSDQFRRQARDLVRQRHLPEAVNARGQSLQIGLLDVELVRDRQQKGLLRVPAQALQVPLGARPAPEAEHFQQDSPIGRPMPSGQRSNGKKPAMPAPSLSTATRGSGRNRPTASVNSGDRNGLAGASSHHRASSCSPSSPGLTTSNRMRRPPWIAPQGTRSGATSRNWPR